MGVKILYGSETGNAEGLANQASEILSKNNIASEVVDMGGVSLDDLKQYEKALFVTSTWGDGDAPGNAIDLLDSLKAQSGKCLEGLMFAVFGIGESFYEHFCQAAVDFDEELSNLGAQRLVEVVKSEDYESDLIDWVNNVMPKLK